MKVHENYISRKVVAASDFDLIGKKIEDFDKGIELMVSKEFYGDNEVDVNEIIQSIAHAENANIIGNRIVELLIDRKLIESKNVITIGGIKHAQIYSI